MLSNTVKGETKVKWISSLTMLFTFFSIISGKVMYGRRHPLTHSKIHSSKQLELSVIVPARDEAQRLPRLLKSLAQQTVSVEMIVMDDGSTDQTAEIARAAGLLSIQFKLINRHYGKVSHWLVIKVRPTHQLHYCCLLMPM